MIATQCKRRSSVVLLNWPRRAERAEANPFVDQPDEPLFPEEEPAEPSDLEDLDFPCTDDDDDDSRWDVFLPDGDPNDPRPEPGDFWIDAEE